RMTPDTTSLYTLSLHDALPISAMVGPIGDEIVSRPGQRDAAGLSERFESGGDVYAVPVDAAVSLLQHVAEIDADAEQHATVGGRSEEHTSELQSRENLVCRLLP